MNLAIVHSRAQDGVAAPPVSVEVHLSGGLPGTSIVGLPETAVKEARDRVRVAIQNARFDYPSRRVTVNLAPADLPKDGGHGLQARYGRRWITSPNMVAKGVPWRAWNRSASRLTGHQLRQVLSRGMRSRRAVFRRFHRFFGAMVGLGARPISGS